MDTLLGEGDRGRLRRELDKYGELVNIAVGKYAELSEVDTWEFYIYSQLGMIYAIGGLFLSVGTVLAFPSLQGQGGSENRGEIRWTYGGIK